MALYASSGAAQLDLSRPGYQSVQGKIEQTDNFKSFPATGNVDKKTIEQFQKLYEEQVRQVTKPLTRSMPKCLAIRRLVLDAPAGDQ